jgi:hypothetical protein
MFEGVGVIDGVNPGVSEGDGDIKTKGLGLLNGIAIHVFIYLTQIGYNVCYQISKHLRYYLLYNAVIKINCYKYTP